MKDNETALQSIDNQIEILKEANRTEKSYLEVISTNGESNGIGQIMSSFQSISTFRSANYCS
jgi:hypothetical protein